MAPLKTLSDRAAEIEANPPKGGDLPGLAEQRVEQAARLKEGAANAEYVTIPGFYSFPSTSLMSCLCEYVWTDEWTDDRPADSGLEACLSMHDAQPALVPWNHPRWLDGSARASSHRPALLRGGHRCVRLSLSPRS